MKIKYTIVSVSLVIFILSGCESTPEYSSVTMSGYGTTPQRPSSSGYGATPQYPSSSVSATQPPSMPGRISVNELCPERVNTAVGDMRDSSDIDCPRDVGVKINDTAQKVAKDAEMITKIPLYR